MSEPTKPRGGARKGAGRPKTNRVQCVLRLDPDNLARMLAEKKRTRSSKSTVINKLLQTLPLHEPNETPAQTS